MKLIHCIAALTPALAWGAPAAAQDVGTTVPAFELKDWSQTEARSWDDLLGRAVLLEFFAYW